MRLKQILRLAVVLAATSGLVFSFVSTCAQTLLARKKVSMFAESVLPGFTNARSTEVENITGTASETPPPPRRKMDLPTWQQVVDMYGDAPVILGLETCERYRRMLRLPSKNSSGVDDGRSSGQNATVTEPMPRVAGLWNSGTNVFAQSLHVNYQNWKTNGQGDNKMYAVPWGKHLPAKYRSTVLRPENPESAMQRYILPIVLVKDPFWWMASMCKAGYKAVWDRTASRCPNLLRNLTNGGSTLRGDSTTTSKSASSTIGLTYNVTVEVRYANETVLHVDNYESLATLWSEWIRGYLEAPYPRLMIRYEDTLFHAEQVMKHIATCVGRTLDGPYRYLKRAAKGHGKSSDFFAALARYGKERDRYNCLTREELDYAKTALDPELLRLFHYRPVPDDDSFLPDPSAPCVKHVVPRVTGPTLKRENERKTGGDR